MNIAKKAVWLGLSFFVAFSCKAPSDNGKTDPTEYQEPYISLPEVPESFSVYIPDPVFKQRLIEEYGADIDGNGEISVGEASKITALVLNYDSDSKYGFIKEFTGIEYFKNLTGFTANLQNQLNKTLDLSLNKKLDFIKLEYSGSASTDLILGNLPVLESLDLMASKFSSLAIDSCPKLTFLDLKYTQGLLGAIDFSKLTYLWNIYAAAADEGVESVNISFINDLTNFRLTKNSSNNGLQTVYVSAKQKKKLDAGELPGWSVIDGIIYKATAGQNR